MMHLEPWQWVLAVVIFANLLPARQASGFVLPMLVFADVVAVASYRRHAQWSYLWKLFPWTALGVVAGYFALGRIDDRQAKVLIGLIVLGLLGLHLIRRGRAKRVERKRSQDPNGSHERERVDESPLAHARSYGAGPVRVAGDDMPEHGVWFAPVIGVLAGFTTLVANAAGPLMVIYLLAMRLPKMEYMGTGAYYFLLMNLFKVDRKSVV